MGDEKDAYYVVRKGDVYGVYKSISDLQSVLRSSVILLQSLVAHFSVQLLYMHFVLLSSFSYCMHLDFGCVIWSIMYCKQEFCN